MVSCVIHSKSERIVCLSLCFRSRMFNQYCATNVTDETAEFHYNDIIMGAIASQITSLTIVYSIVYSDADQRKHQSSASLAFVWGIQREPVNSPHKWPLTRKMFPFEDVIMVETWWCIYASLNQTTNGLGNNLSHVWRHFDNLTLTCYTSFNGYLNQNIILLIQGIPFEKVIREMSDLSVLTKAGVFH